MKNYIKTYVREANLRLYYVIFSWLLCFLCCYLKSTQIIYLTIKPTLNKTRLRELASQDYSPSFREARTSLTPEEKTNFTEALNSWASVTLKMFKQHFLLHKEQELSSGRDVNKGFTATASSDEGTAGKTSASFIYTNVTEAFYATLEAAITFSLLFILPMLLYQLWSFLVTGRYERERIYFNKLSLKLSLFVMFFLWLIICYLLPQICQFLQLFALETGKLQIINQPRIAPLITWVFSTVLTLLAISLTPLCIYLCLKHGIFSKTFLTENRRTTACFLLILAAFLSPADLSSQLTISLVLFVFFESVIWFYLYKMKS